MFKRNVSGARPFRSIGQSKPSGLVDRSKFKCFKCGLAGHFSNEYRKPSAEKKSSTTEGVHYRKLYVELLKQKERAFIIEERTGQLMVKIQMMSILSSFP